ncbi:aminoglycoside 3-N-acetyltransferase [Fictibacillus enclensis]|uniref:aminoglycoside N(3)-acetyltransferase n=1 Tax=Fictibacillus enclensis TaxID=1017270 RepID=UPI000815FD48|nr:AAC(3) family N-acetyltransferase [Fictibacillus enclensis]SCC32915.1 aminoglycoside 3-N-acetyltransferase [Fictibacillus enclensis]
MINTEQLVTRSSLVQDFKKLGVQKGMTVIVHTSLSKMGWVCGGAVAVVQALMDVVTEEGNLIMPTHSAELSDPAGWGNPPVPKEWWETIRSEMPAFDPAISPTYFMGAVAEVFRTFPGVIRSNHPTVSFAAWGKDKEWITGNHSLDNGLGESSPIARIYDLDGSILLIGVGHDSNTSMHLAEYRVPGQKQVEEESPVIESGQRIWKTYKQIEYQEELFEEIGRQYEENYGQEIKIAGAGSATCRLMKQKKLVDFTENWLKKNIQMSSPM